MGGGGVRQGMIMITDSMGFLRLPLLYHSKGDDSTQFIEHCADGHNYLYTGSSHVTQHHVTIGKSHYDRITSHYSALVRVVTSLFQQCRLQTVTITVTQMFSHQHL